MKKLSILFLALCSYIVSFAAQESESATNATTDSVLYTSTFYFERNNCEWIEKYEYIKVGKLLRWAEANSSALIDIKGWAEQIETENINARIAFKRAKAIRSYLVQKGIDPSRITFESMGVDPNADTNKARRAEVVAYIRAVNREQTSSPDLSRGEEEIETQASNDVMAEQEIEDARAAEPIEDIDTEMQVEPEPETETILESEPEEEIEEEIETQPETKTETEDTRAAEPIEDIDTEMQVEPEPETILESEPGEEYEEEQPQYLYLESETIIDPLSYYVGGGVGLLPMWSTFSGTGFNLHLFTNVELTKLISTELSLGYSHINMSATHCCEDLYYVDGERYFSPVAGMTSYRYGDLTSKVDMLRFTIKVNFNVVSLFVKESVWSSMISPKISYIQSWANIQNDGVSISKECSPHFGVGGDLSVGYMINNNWGVRLTTGIEYLTGKGVDGMPQYEHNSNTIWNTNASVIYKF